MTIVSAIQFTSRTVIVLGASVLLGWHIGALWLVQLHPAFPPMQYNAAVCFLLAGIAAMCACTRVRLSGTLGVAVAAIGFVTVMQYVLGRSLGIDELLLRSYVTVETSQPGRMAPQTAIGFLLAGSALVLLTFARSLPHAKLLAEILSSLLGGLGVTVAIGYGAGIESAYGWFDATRVALHTAFGFAVLASAILLNSWRLYAADKSERPVLAIPVAVGALAVTLALFQALLTWQVERVQAATARDAERATAALEERLHGYVEKFGSLAASWSRAGVGPHSSWEADVARFLRDQPEFLAISHIDADGTLDWIFPSIPYPEHVGFDYSRDDRRAYWLAAARERGGPLLTEPLALKTGRPGVLLVAPLARGPGEPASSIVAAALLHDLFRPSAFGMPAHRLTAFQGERVIYGSESDADLYTIRGRELAIDGLALQLSVTPLAETLASWRSALPAVVLASGLLASLLLAATAHLAQVSSHRALDLSAANARLKVARDKLERLALFDELTGSAIAICS